MQIAIGVLLFTILHICVWWATNAQFIEGWSQESALMLSVLLSIPITLLAFFASRYTYFALDGHAWAVRFVGFGTSYLIFPVLTWYFLNESMFTVKTLACIFLSVVIIYIQLRF